MPEYAGMCMGIPKSTCMAFILHFPVAIPWLPERLVTYFNVYTKREVII